MTAPRARPATRAPAVEFTPRTDARAVTWLREQEQAGAQQSRALFAHVGPRDASRIYSVLIGFEPANAPRDVPDYRWHISVAGEEDVPTWADFAAIVHRLRPGVVFCVPMPPRSWWINIHPHCLHVHEVKDENLVASWREQARGDTPT